MSSSLEFSVRLPMFGEEASPETFEALATTGEAAGFDCVIAGDHIAFPADISSDHPSSEPHENPPYMRSTADCYDLFQTLSFLAGVTDTIQIGTNVCIAPYRHPVILTKNALTLSALSHDRFEFGVGAGWMRSEFEVLDVPFDERGPRTDEFLDIFTRACEHGELAYDGRFHSFQETGFYPAPPSGSAPKLWIGGSSGAAFRRVAEYGDGWTISLSTPEDVEADRDRLMNAWSDYNRSGEPEIAVREILHIDPDRTEEPRSLIGPVDSIIDQLNAYVDVNVTRFIMTIEPDDLDDQLDQVTRVGREIIPSF